MDIPGHETCFEVPKNTFEFPTEVWSGEVVTG
jgi:hypothetical protein